MKSLRTLIIVAALTAGFASCIIVPPPRPSLPPHSHHYGHYHHGHGHYR